MQATTFPARFQLLGNGKCLSIATDDYMHVRAGQSLVSNDNRDYFAFILEPHPDGDGGYQLRAYYTRRTRLVDWSRVLQPSLALTIDHRSNRAVLGSRGASFVLHRGVGDSVALYFGDRRFLMFDPRDHHYYVRRVDLDHFASLSCFRVFEMPNAVANPHQLELVRFVADGDRLTRAQPSTAHILPMRVTDTSSSAVPLTEWLL